MPGWTVTVTYLDPTNLALENLGIVQAEYDPPGPGKERFQFRPALLKRADIDNPASPERQDYINRAIAALASWELGQDWSGVSEPALEADLDAATPP